MVVSFFLREHLSSPNLTSFSLIDYPISPWFPEGVGKSSLISTFVSRYFSEVVQGIMTRVRLPPDPNSSCITTIVDSQGADSALLSAVAAMSLSPTGGVTSTDSFSSFMQRAEASRISTGTPHSHSGANTSTVPAGGVENVDSIILVYDLDRVETFFRLENHWLPLIERCYNGEVNALQMDRMAEILMILCFALCFCVCRTSSH
jgi:mitochondrial Rho GTPase 1